MINAQATHSGSLYVVATPIGNRDDISLRALSILKSVDFIIAEDTRHSAPLLSYLGVKKPMTSLHSFNEGNKSEQLIQSLLQGESAALISDAGTPLISDPGFPLVKLAREQQIPVIPIPGACALIAALSAAGVPCELFTFAGFLPAKQSARLSRLTELSSIHHTLVFYESTHRIVDCLVDLLTVFGEDCEMVLAKELTKSYEKLLAGTGSELIAWLQDDKAHQKGEFVLIISPRPQSIQASNHQKLLSTLMAELPLKQAVKLASMLTEENKNDLYKIALSLQNKTQ